MRVRVIFLLLYSLLILTACEGQNNDPVFVVATPVPADANFITYQHSSGVFSLRIPPDWVAGDLPDANGVRVQFTALEGDQAVTRLSVYVVNTGDPMTPEAFAQAVNAYQPPPMTGEKPVALTSVTAAAGSRAVARIRHWGSAA
jgi:hypothetical protein